jgi:hypothetical protein
VTSAASVVSARARARAIRNLRATPSRKVSRKLRRHRTAPRAAAGKTIAAAAEAASPTIGHI